jgi:hypothetical protein
MVNVGVTGNYPNMAQLFRSGFPLNNILQLLKDCFLNYDVFFLVCLFPASSLLLLRFSAFLSVLLCFSSIVFASQA